MSLLRIENGALVRAYNGEILRIEPWGKNTLRVRCTPHHHLSLKNYALLPQEKIDAKIEIENDEGSITNGNVRACVDKNGKITFYNQDGKVLLEEALELQPLRKDARHFTPRLLGGYELNMSFKSEPKEKIYGMGQYQMPYLDLKGCTLELAHRNSQASVPFYISSLGYGFLWNIPAIGEVSFSKNITKWNASLTNELDYIIIVEHTPRKIEEQYMQCVGRAPKMPRQALGLWQSKLRYRTQEELMAVARKYKELKIPLSVIVCDFFHWPHQGDFCFDYDYFPDPVAMTKELKEMGCELMVSIWPTVEFGGDNYKEMLEKGYLVSNDRGPANHTEAFMPAVFYDTTNKGAREYVWSKVKKNYYDKGIRLFWLDEAEPEYMLYDFDNHRYFEGNCAEIGNMYPVYYAKGFYDGLINSGESEPITLIRCAWAGSAKYGTLVWSGDIMPTFEALANQVRAGLSMAIAGIPWWTTDVGGFDYGDPQDESYQECVIRWFEYATFCPVLRLHGYRAPYIPADENAKRGGMAFTGGEGELWSFGDTAFEIMKKHVFLRKELEDYIMKQMDVAHKEGTPPMRPLFYSHPEDEKCWDVDDEYMFGEDLLVCPVMELGAREREVYLPSSNAWINAYTGEKINGGVSIKADAPLERIPLFVREGSSLRLDLFKGI